MAVVILPNEKSLSQRLKNGDYEAFTDIYNKYSPLLYANLFKLTKSEAIAEDFLQDIFFKLWQNRADIDPDKSIKNYLITISYNLFKNSLRRLKIEERLQTFLAYSQSAVHDDVADQISFKETENLIRSAIERLPPKRKQVYHLCRVEGLTYEQAATMLGVSVGTIHDHISKANKFIKEQLLSSGSAEICGFFLFSYFLI